MASPTGCVEMNAPSMANLLTFEQFIATYGAVTDAEGWWISNDSDDNLEIQSIGLDIDDYCFQSDLQADRHVRQMAWRGSPLHVHALGVLVRDRLGW